jgi:hypothetical protein
MDRIKTDDADNLAYLARRFGASCCVGMNQESYLLREIRDEGVVPREHFTSMGEKDGVYVFDALGRKAMKSKGEEIVLP